MVTVESIKEEIVNEFKVYLYALTYDTDNSTKYYVATYVMTDTFQYIPEYVFNFDDLYVATNFYNDVVEEARNMI